MTFSRARVVYIGTQDLEFQDLIFRGPTQLARALLPCGHTGTSLVVGLHKHCHLAPNSMCGTEPGGPHMCVAHRTRAGHTGGGPPRSPGKGRIRSKIWSGARMKRFASVPPPQKLTQLR